MTSPAQVSGPGALSKRTDAGGQKIRRLPDADYGEAQEFREQQKAAPLAKTPSVPAGPAPSAPARGGPPGAEAPAGPPVKLPGLFDQGDPSIPGTAGAPRGDGPNSIAGLPPGAGDDFNPTGLREALEPYVAADPSGILRETIYALSERGMW